MIMMGDEEEDESRRTRAEGREQKDESRRTRAEGEDEGLRLVGYERMGGGREDL